MSKAARLASVDRTTLYRLLERHGFRRELNEPRTWSAQQTHGQWPTPRKLNPSYPDALAT